MATVLDAIPADQFRSRLEASGCGGLSADLVRTLLAHYAELRRWAGRLALVSAGEAEVIVERHYAESLRALPLLGDASTVLDLGSGAGFPGQVLAAARPDRRFWLFESRVRKASFLRAAADKAELSCRIVNARVSARHPVTATVAEGTIDLVTVRGVRIDRDIWAGLEPGLAFGARILRWEGPSAAPWPQASLGRVVELPGHGRRIQEWLPPAESP